MAAATKTRGFKQPPRRGVPFYDVASGRMKILPPKGGKIVDYVGPDAPAFSARKALRQAGVRSGRAAVNAGDRAARKAPSSARRAVKRADALPNLGGSPGGFGGLLVYAFATIVGLALLENALGGRGPAAVETVLGAFGGGIRKLTSPTDPLIGRGTVPAAAAAAPSSSTPTASSSGASRAVGKVRFTGSPLNGLKPGFLSSLSGAAAAAGATVVDVISGYRSNAHSQAVGGFAGDPHTKGTAVDGRAYIPGRGWVPLGTALNGVAGQYGLVSGDKAGFYQGQRDPNHVQQGGG